MKQQTREHQTREHQTREHQTREQIREQRIQIRRLAPAGYQAVAELERCVSAAVDPTTLALVKVRASVINSCAYCIDLHTGHALAAGEDRRRLSAVAAWQHAPFFDDRERAALALTDAVTRLEPAGVPDQVWADALDHWSEAEVAHLILAIGTINLWNRIAVSTGTQPAVT